MRAVPALPDPFLRVFPCCYALQTFSIRFFSRRALKNAVERLRSSPASFSPPLPAVPSRVVIRWQVPCRSSSWRSSYGVPVGPFITEMVVYTLYFTRDITLRLFGHSERQFPVGLHLPPACRSAGAVPPSTCLDLNFNADGPQSLEAIQGIVLMLFNLFFLSALVILASAAAVFGPSPIACGRSDRTGPAPSVATNFCRDEPQWLEGFEDIELTLSNLFLPMVSSLWSQQRRL
jgi:hypothetical protein